MNYCISFDITSDKVRRDVTKLIKKTGLVRIQKSVFIGRSDSSRIKSLETSLILLLEPVRDRLFIAPLDTWAFQQMAFLGLMPDKELLTRQTPVRFF
jgi:CRISPR-associated protein Cas2